MITSKTISESNGSIKAAIILALVVLIAYSPIIFLNQTFNSSIPAGTDLHIKKYLSFPTTIDPGADYTAILPEHVLAVKEYLHGMIPLWNPYIGSGQPLAADSINYIFSPLFVIFFLPSSVWSVSLLVAVWGAGIFMFLFLRNIGLAFHSSLIGGIFYMLSGAFTWYLPHTSVPVILFTPFILYSIEKILQNKDPRYIPVASIAISCSVLGAHIESLILQSILIIFYLTYRIIRNVCNKQDIKSRPSVKRVVVSSFLAFLGALGLSSFFVIPVYELIQNSTLGHGVTAGITYAQPYTAITNFVPYIMGPVQSYWSAVMESQGEWNILWGYVGIFALFFSVIGILTSIRNKSDYLHKYTPVFFLGISVFFIMKTVGVPIINWIGYIPVLDYIVFPRYSGTIIPIGFAVAGAFGIDSITHSTNSRNIGIGFVITVMLILIMTIPILPYFSDQKISVTTNNVIEYVGFQVILAISFASLALLISIAMSKNKTTIIGLTSLVILELTSYIPMGLDPTWMTYKETAILGGMVLITLFTLRSIKIKKFNSKKIKFVVIMILVASTCTIVFISAKSPYGLIQRHEIFSPNQLTEYIKENIDNSRIFSLTTFLGPNYPSAYDISTLGFMDAFSPLTLGSFTHNFLDPDAWSGTNLGYPPWTRSYGPIIAQEKIANAKKYFDFMGVKYFIAQNYDLNTTMIGSDRTITSHSISLPAISNSIKESFTSPSNTISGVGMSFYAKTFDNLGKIKLVLDSIPYDTKYHRESYLNVTNIRNSDFNIFWFSPLEGIKNKKLSFSLEYSQASQNNNIKIYYFENNENEYKFVKNNLNGTFYQDGIHTLDRELAFFLVQNPNSLSNFSYNGLNLIENKNVFPRAYLVDRYELVPKDTTLDFLKNNPNFDLRHNVVLEEPPLNHFTNDLQPDKIEGDSAKIESYTENNVKILTKNSRESILILTDTYYPGWKAFIDKNETHIYKADGLVRVIFVPAGVHNIEFSYMPESFTVGLDISLITFIIMIIVLIYFTIRKKFTLTNNVLDTSHSAK